MINNIFLISLITFFILFCIIYLGNYFLNNTDTIKKNLFNFKMKFKRKKLQMFFYDFEKYQNIINIYGKKYLRINNFILLIVEVSKKIKLDKNTLKIIIVYYSKYEKYFNYTIDKENFNRVVTNNSLNFFKINTEKKKKIEIKKKDSEILLKTFFIKKKEKKKLVLILILDGLGANLTKYIDNSNNFFSSNNSLKNMHSNAPWTLPALSNLFTGQFSSRHLNYQPRSFYYNAERKEEDTSYLDSNLNLFEFFKKNNFITGSYSPYARVNPTYNFDKGVDLFKYCHNESADEIIDNIISQLEMFKDKSNFIFAHLFDLHHNLKNFNRLSDYVKFPDQNDNYSLKNSLKNQKNFTNKHINKLEKFKSGKNFYEQKNSISALKYCDIRLQVLYSYLKRKNFDDYTIVLMGDHGTTFDESKRTNVLTKNHQNVGFFIKDKKNKFTKKKNKLIETIDIFPSLVSRYSKNKTKFSSKEFDGKNTLFSNYKKEFLLAESIYGSSYELFIRYKNVFLNSSYKKNKNLLTSISNTFLTDTTIRIKPKNIIKKITLFKNKHIKKLKLK